MLDRMPPWARDLVVSLISTLAAWAGLNLVPVLNDAGGVYAAVLAPLVVFGANVLVPQMTRRYGLGAVATRSGTPTGDQPGGGS